MCFSTTASFGAGIILTAFGTAALVKSENKSQSIFASIPLIFAVQQFTEGFVWLSLSNADYAIFKWPATYIFLFFAQVVWPFLVPFSILRLEKEQKRKKNLKILTVIGAVVSIYLAYCLISFPVEAQILGMHISYEQDYPQELSLYCGLLYIIVTIIPPFFSSLKGMWTLGTSILLSYIITSIFYTDYIVSVWCFFASIISITVLYVILKSRKPHSQYLSIKTPKNPVLITK